MPYTKLFDSCSDSIGGVKTLRLSAKLSDNSPIIFPIDIIFASGGTETILLTDNVPERLISINSVDYTYRIILPTFVEFQQEIQKTRQGIVYNKSLAFSIPKVDLVTNNQIRSFLFGQGEQFAISNIMAFITDLNNQDWIVSFDLPLVLEEFDLKTDKRNGDNSYVFKYNSKSYLPALKYMKV
jgi:hypothetical protein